MVVLIKLEEIIVTNNKITAVSSITACVYSNGVVREGCSISVKACVVEVRRANAVSTPSYVNKGELFYSMQICAVFTGILPRRSKETKGPETHLELR